MWQVHSEWPARIHPIGATSLTRPFRRYFDRFEGRIKEPPFVVFDDLVYHQGSAPEEYTSPHTHTELALGNVGGIITGANLEEYQEHLRGFEMDIGKKEDVMQAVYHSGELSQSSDLGEFYAFPVLPAKHNQAFSNADSFRAMLEPQGYQTAGAATGIISPTARGNFQSMSLHPSASATRGGLLVEETPDFPLEEDELGLGNWDDLFENISDMPGLDGVIDRNFLEFLDTSQ
jgi:hypothetical protein